ncbi:MAG: serine/threonine protein phosphatase [Planctomycetota bacterium]|nr:MAG: serine/threonine protein phosphatase [Planctomycetota bacterium]
MRTIAIGDVHGCSKALRGLIDAIAPTSSDRLIFLGDYVDRGPDSRGVLDCLLELESHCQSTFLLGNHDIMFRGVIRGLDPHLWLEIGGQPTLASFGGTLAHIGQRYVDFLDRCLPFYETQTHIFVHANYHHDLPMENQPEQALFWEHLNVRMPLPHISGKHVVCGHTPQSNGEISRHTHLTCIDTACYAGLWLTGWCIETGETWQVSAQGHLRQRPLWQRWQRWLQSRLRGVGMRQASAGE